MSNTDDSPETKVIEGILIDGVSYRFYGDNRPRNGEIKDIQKGMVLIHRDRMIIGEGSGFGVPLAMYDDKTIFPGHAKITLVNPRKIVKCFELDLVSRKRICRIWIPDFIDKGIEKIFNKFYMKVERLRSFFDFLIWLRRVSGFKTEFVRVEPRGRVLVTYKICEEGLIHVQAKFDCVRDGLVGFSLLNEQDADYFSEYRDTDGICVSGRDIGAWKKVYASSASFFSPSCGLSYSLDNQEGIELFRGWERVLGSHSWSGLDYLITPMDEFEYGIRVRYSNSK